MPDDPTPFPELLAQFHRDPQSLLRKIPGIWLVNKPSGPSSNLVVTRARRALNLKRVGHAGTLDPLASGLLILLAGNATRLFDHLQERPKTYRAGFKLGVRTDTQDSTGIVLNDFIPARQPPFSAAEVTGAMSRFRGEILQTPPMHSAIKKDGKRLYKLARQGVTIERTARPATVYALSLEEFDGTAGVLEMTVSKGFYVRTLVDDLGLALGCGAVMTSLIRTRIGEFGLTDVGGLDNLLL